VHEAGALKSQVEKIKEEIQAYGESIVAHEQLRVLCADLTVSDQWNAIAKIAITEGWSFTFFPNGSVRFANL